MPLNIKVAKPVKPKKFYEKKILKATIKDFLKGKLLDEILEEEYKYERLDFNQKLEYKTTTGFIKMLMKTINYKYDFVYNDVLAKQFNGLKTIITHNTKMQKIFLKVNEAKPLSVYKLKYKKITGLLPKLKEFFNLTGNSTGFKNFLFYDTLKYNYTHNLKTFGLSKKILMFSLMTSVKQCEDFITTSNKYVSQTYRKKILKINTYGFKLKLRNKAQRFRYKFAKVLELKRRRTFTFRKRKQYFKILFKKFIQKILSSKKIYYRRKKYVSSIKR
jgi:hypothetical protein